MFPLQTWHLHDYHNKTDAIDNPKSHTIDNISTYTIYNAKADRPRGTGDQCDIWKRHSGRVEADL